MLRYLRNLDGGGLILWCYFAWWLVVVVRYWDPSPQLWLTSLGISAIVGFALMVNALRAMGRGSRLPFWPAFRLFAMPFCVSSFAALVKGRGFFLVFSPDPWEVGGAAGLCALLWAVWFLGRRIPEWT
jgi:hypothetical protein